MKNEQILKKAIEKAVKNGWTPPGDIQVGIGIHMSWEFIFDDILLYAPRIIFSHNFAKAFFGGEIRHEHFKFFDGKDLTKNCGCNAWWQYHLQQMVLEKDPIKYLEQFI